MAAALPRVVPATTLISILRGVNDPVFLLGAGASKSSGIPLADEVAEVAARWGYCWEKGYVPNDPRAMRSDWHDWLKTKSWYESDNTVAENYAAVLKNCLNPRTYRREFFRTTLSNHGRISDGYRAFVRLLHQRSVRTVLTTNFDDLIEQAKTAERVPHHLEVIRTRADLVKFSTNPADPQLVYLHGSVDHYSEQALETELEKIDEELAERITPLLRDHPLVVCGYRGAEKSIMKDLFGRAVNSGFKHGVFWCVMKGTQAQIHPHVSELAQQVGDNFFLVEIENFDRLTHGVLWPSLQSGPHATKTAAAGRAPAATIPADFQPVAPSAIVDLDFALLRECLNRYSAQLRIPKPDNATDAWYLELAERSHLIMRDESSATLLTVAGALLFGRADDKRPVSAKVRIIDLRADENAETADARSTGANRAESEPLVSGTLWAQFNSVSDALSQENQPYKLKGQISETVYPYPPLAIREVVVNALVHRNYQSDAYTTIEIGANFLRVISPGGLDDAVKAQLDGKPLFDAIREGKRGIKGYRNPVLADIFYGGGAMEKAGSGLADVYSLMTKHGARIELGPNSSDDRFEVTLWRRPDIVDETTKTATPFEKGFERYAANVLAIQKLPTDIYFCPYAGGGMGEVLRNEPGLFGFPFHLFENNLISPLPFASIGDSLTRFVDWENEESQPFSEFVRQPDHLNIAIRLIKECLLIHFARRGLIVDRPLQRAYFPRADSPVGEVTIEYRARVRSAKRTVVKARRRPNSDEVRYWEHEAISYDIERFGNDWSLVLAPTYVFTRDGFNSLVAPDKMNRLSTKRASIDYNQSVHNDLVFWARSIAGGQAPVFNLDFFPTAADAEKLRSCEIVLTSDLPSISLLEAEPLDAEAIAGAEALEGDDFDSEMLSALEEEDVDDQ